MRVLKHFQLAVTQDEITSLAVLSKTLRKYKCEDPADDENKLTFSAIVYDRLLYTLKDELYPHSREGEEFPFPPDSWNEGHFRLDITRCAACYKHQLTSWH
jgi:hypothetical protein